MTVGRSGAGPPTLVVLRALGLGDLLTGLPALRGVRAAFPDHELVLAAPERLHEAVRLLGCVDRLLPTVSGGRAVPESLAWQGAPPDVAVNLHGKGPQSRELLETLRPGRLLAFGPGGPAWRRDEHERARWCRMLRWFGIAADPDDLLLPGFDSGSNSGPGSASGSNAGLGSDAGSSSVSNSGSGSTSGFNSGSNSGLGSASGSHSVSNSARSPSAPVLLHPGADAPARRWPAFRFASLAAGLTRQGFTVLVTAGRGEDRLARNVARRAGLDRSAVVGGDTDIPFEDLVALIGSSRALISGDTGVAHLAVATATPSVTLFGPVSPALWGPPPLPHHVALWHPDPDSDLRPGDPAAATPDARLLRISVTEVLDALARVLQ